MRIMFAISVVAFVALLWAFISTAQHIRRARRRRKLASSSDFATPAETKSQQPPPAETGNPSQRFPLSSPRSVRFNESPTPEPSTGPPPPPRPEPPKPSSMINSRPATSPFAGERQDWAYFNKDMGDLSDPAPSRRYKDRSRSR